MKQHAASDLCFWLRKHRFLQFSWVLRQKRTFFNLNCEWFSLNQLKLCYLCSSTSLRIQLSLLASRSSPLGTFCQKRSQRRWAKRDSCFRRLMFYSKSLFLACSHHLWFRKERKSVQMESWVEGQSKRGPKICTPLVTQLNSNPRAPPPLPKIPSLQTTLRNLHHFWSNFVWKSPSKMA